MVLWLQRADEHELSSKTIILREPWTADADARVVEQDEESRLPPDALAHGHKYLL